MGDSIRNGEIDSSQIYEDDAHLKGNGELKEYENDNKEDGDDVDVDDGNPETKLANGGKKDKDEDKKTKLTFRQKWKDKTYRTKYLYSIFMGGSFLTLGMFAAEHGATFLDVQILTNTDLETAAFYFVAGTIGYLIGSVITGFVFDKVNSTLFLFGSIILMGVLNIVLPYCTVFEVMLVARFICSMFSSFLDTGQNTEHLKVWGTEEDGLLQFLHFTFSFGGMMAPLIAEPFLAKKRNKHDLSGLNSNSNSTSVTNSVNRSSNSLNETLAVMSNFTSNTTDTPLLNRDTRVQYVYLIIGLIIIISALPFIYIYFKLGRQSKKEEKENRKFARKNVPMPILYFMLGMMCVMYFMYCCVEDTFLSFLMTFLVNEFDSISKSKGAQISAVSWGAFAVARFTMIFVAKSLKPSNLLLIMTTSMVLSLFAFMIAAYFRVVDGMIVFSAITAIGFSGIFPAGFSWMEAEMFKVTAGANSAIFVASGLGATLDPIILSRLMEEYDNMWFCYLLTLEAVIMYVVMVSLLLFSRYYVDKKYGKLLPSSPSSQVVVNGDDDADDGKNNGEGLEELNLNTV